MASPIENWWNRFLFLALHHLEVYRMHPRKWDVGLMISPTWLRRPSSVSSCPAVAFPESMMAAMVKDHAITLYSGSEM